MNKSELLAAIAVQQNQDISDMSADLDAQAAAIAQKKSDLMDRINKNYALLISEVSSLPDADADSADLQKQLSDAKDALAAETALEVADAAKVVGLQGKIDAALAILNPSA